MEWITQRINGYTPTKTLSNTKENLSVLSALVGGIHKALKKLDQLNLYSH